MTNSQIEVEALPVLPVLPEQPAPALSAPALSILPEQPISPAPMAALPREKSQEEAAARVLGTRVNRMVLHGFKSFANRTEFLFGEKFNCVVGPNGSGKCVEGDTLVQLSNGSLIKIRDLVEKNLGSTEKIDDGYIAYASKGSTENILCLDTSSMKISKKPIQAFVKRETPEYLLKITTKSGRSITATKYHPLFIFDNETVRSIQAEELREGVRIAVPRIIVPEIKHTIFYELLDFIQEKDDIYVPFDLRFKEILSQMKSLNRSQKRCSSIFWSELAEKIGVPEVCLSGLNDHQAVNFAYLVRILRFAMKTDDEIIALIPEVKSKTSSVTCRMPWRNSPEFARFLGLLLAEGRLPKLSHQIWFTNGSEEVVEEYAYLVESVFGLEASVNEYKQGCWDVIAYSEPLRKLLTKFGMPIANTEYKTVTNLFLAHSTNEELSELLNGLYSGDGYVSDTSIEIITKSKMLATAIETILLRLGLLHSAKFVVKKATNSGYEGIYKNISIYGGENFRRFRSLITLVHQEKNKKITKVAAESKRGNPNVDLIDCNSLIKKVAKNLGINIKKSKKTHPKLDAYCYNQCTPSRAGVSQLLKEVLVPTNRNMYDRQNCGICQELVTLQTISASDIFWDQIASIQKIVPKEKWVYDLCVEENHNFIANNFFVHNSNLLDAICFVLGKSSSRALRAEKAANLLYNGGKSKKPSSFGEVSIYFDNTTKVFPAAEEEIKISRVVKADGQSRYKINERTCTRNEILDLLSAAKINPDGYNIILQGDIVRFVEMTPIEQRQVVEEIAGISIYEEKKEKALRELERVEQRLNEAEIVLKERESQLKALKKDRDQALKHKELSERINVNMASYIYLQMEKKELEKSNFDKLIAEEQAAIEKERKAIEAIKQEIAGKNGEIRKITEKIEREGEEEQVRLNKDVELLKTSIITKKAKIDSCNSEIEKLGQKIQQLEKDFEENKAKIAKIKEESSELGKRAASVQKDRAGMEQKISEFRKKHQLDNIGDIEKEIEESDKNAEEKQKQVQQLREEQQELIRQNDKLLFQLQSLDDKMLKVREIENANKAQIDELKQKRQRFKNSTIELNKRLSEDSILAAELANARNKTQKIEEELSQLRLKSFSIKASIAGNEAIKKILENKQQWNTVYGTVSELGSVESKYGLALEVAAGPKLKSIVVSDDKAGAECIKWLKQNRHGSATFLPMNKIRQPTENAEVDAALKANGVHGLAADLVSYDLKFKKVFLHVFGNTIIVDNIDAARRIGIGKLRMATLDGDLCESTGAMTGGFVERKGRGAGFQEKEVVENMARLEQELSRHSKTLIDSEQRKTDNEEMIAKLRSTKAELEGDIIKLERSLHLESSDLDASKRQKELLEEEIRKVEEKLRELQSKITSQNREAANIKAKKQELRNKIGELRSPTLIAELTAFEQKKTELIQEALKTENALANNTTRIDNIFAPESEKLEKLIKQSRKEGLEFKEDAARLQRESEDESQVLAEKEKKAKEFYQKFKEAFDQRTKLSDEIQKLNEKILFREDSSRKMEQKINNASISNAEIRATLVQLSEQFEKYRGVQLDTAKSEAKLKKEIDEFEKMRVDLGMVNLRALEIFDQVEKEYKELVEKKDKLKTEKDSVVELMNEIDSKKKELFMRTFNSINNNFKRIFSTLYTKGEAYMEIENAEDPFQAGVEIKVRLTGTKFIDLKSLSGGEKTLTGLAFIFAIQEYEPASFYILDEVDAALDKNNSKKLAELLQNYSKRAQYIVISHNDNIVTSTDILYGITMNEHGQSSAVSIRM